jgi:hypothetical protein
VSPEGGRCYTPQGKARKSLDVPREEEKATSNFIKELAPAELHVFLVVGPLSSLNIKQYKLSFGPTLALEFIS